MGGDIAGWRANKIPTFFFHFFDVSAIKVYQQGISFVEVLRGRDYS